MHQNCTECARAMKREGLCRRRPHTEAGVDKIGWQVCHRRERAFGEFFDSDRVSSRDAVIEVVEDLSLKQVGSGDGVGILPQPLGERLNRGTKPESGVKQNNMGQLAPPWSEAPL